MADLTQLPRVVVIGASYGMLLAMRMAVAGVSTTVVGREEEVATIRGSGGPRLRIASREGAQIELSEADVTGDLTLASPDAVNLDLCDLVFLAASEPQYSGPGLRDLMERIAHRRIPCVSLMNVPPLAFLQRLPGVDQRALGGVYSSRAVWDLFEPQTITASSPDPQSIRPAPDHPEINEVTLPSNFKVAPFSEADHQSLVDSLAAALDRSVVVRGDVKYHPRVRLKPERSIYTPLAKWPMLVVGNCRCVTDGEPVSIREAVHSDLDTSRELYEWVVHLCTRLGAIDSVMIPFDKYAKAALDLSRPSSLARALRAGIKAVERPDKLVRQLARSWEQAHPELDAIVMRIDKLTY